MAAERPLRPALRISAASARKCTGRIGHKSRSGEKGAGSGDSPKHILDLPVHFLPWLLMFHVLVQQLPGGFRAFPEGERSPCARIARHVPQLPQLTLLTTFVTQVSLLS